MGIGKLTAFPNSCKVKGRTDGHPEDAKKEGKVWVYETADF